jgi:hypothetical protein
MINSLIEKNSLTCLNEDSNHPLINAMGTKGPNEMANEDTFVQSDMDAELLIQMKFINPVKLTGIQFSIAGKDEDAAPKIVKLFSKGVG